MDEDTDPADSLISLYRTFSRTIGWSAKEMDETNFDTLMEFIWHNAKPDPNVRIIGGKEYRRAKGIPNWL